MNHKIKEQYTLIYYYLSVNDYNQAAIHRDKLIILLNNDKL